MTSPVSVHDPRLRSVAERVRPVVELAGHHRNEVWLLSQEDVDEVLIT